MMRYSTEQHVFLVEDYIKIKKFYNKCVCKLCHQYPYSPVPRKPNKKSYIPYDLMKQSVRTLCEWNYGAL
jgi:hypothetical protein